MFIVYIKAWYEELGKFHTYQQAESFIQEYICLYPKEKPSIHIAFKETSRMRKFYDMAKTNN